MIRISCVCDSPCGRGLRGGGGFDLVENVLGVEEVQSCEGMGEVLVRLPQREILILAPVQHVLGVT